MNTFKITNTNMRQLAREVKLEIKGDYTEVAIMYNTETEEFYITETFNIDKAEAEGHVVYKIFTHYATDGNLTLKEIEEKIFN